MHVATLILHFQLPACQSLKEKRSQVKPILARLHKEFNVSVAEIDRQDHWQEAVLAVGMVGNDAAFLQRALQEVAHFSERTWPDAPLLENKIEIW
jgi:uncharacterized protein YlxP (DUF503 family)